MRGKSGYTYRTYQDFGAKNASFYASDKSHYGNDVPFEVPEGWVWCNITEITYKITDGTHHSPISYPRGDYMYVTAKNIKESGVSLDNMTFVTSEVFRDVFSRCNPELGDILYIKDGATTGVVTINDIKDPFCLLSSVALIKPSKSIDRKYLLYYSSFASDLGRRPGEV